MNSVHCKGGFTITTVPVADDSGDACATSISIESNGFEADARGLGHVLGSLVGWWLDGAEAAEPELRKGVHRLAILAEVHRGMAQGMERDTVVPVVKS